MRYSYYIPSEEKNMTAEMLRKAQVQKLVNMFLNNEFHKSRQVNHAIAVGLFNRFCIDMK